MTEELELLPRQGDWLQTFSGKSLYPFDIRPEDIDINDIAHALSLMCRFNGHCKEFYSVAEHSVRVAWHMENKYREYGLCTPTPDKTSIYGLTHDMQEFILCDFPRPLKRNFPEYKKLEKDVYECILKKFGLSTDFDNIPCFDNYGLSNGNKACYFPTRNFIPVNEAVKKADNILLATEKRDLMEREPQDWHLDAEPLDERIVPYSSKDAERLFLSEFYRLYKGMSVLIPAKQDTPLADICKEK